MYDVWVLINVIFDKELILRRSCDLHRAIQLRSESSCHFHNKYIPTCIETIDFTFYPSCASPPELCKPVYQLQKPPPYFPLPTGLILYKNNTGGVYFQHFFREMQNQSPCWNNHPFKFVI